MIVGNHGIVISLHCGAGMLECLRSWQRAVLAASGHGKNKETTSAGQPHQSGTINLLDPPRLIINVLLAPHNTLKEAENVRWFVRRSSLPIQGTMNSASRDVH